MEIPTLSPSMPSVGPKNLLPDEEQMERHFDTVQRGDNEGEAIELDTMKSNEVPIIDTSNFLGPFEKNLEESSSFFGQLLFTFLSPILKLGSQKQLSIDDLPNVSTFLRAAPVVCEFDHYWNKQLKKEKPSLTMAYWLIMAPIFKKTVPYLIIFAALPFLSPYFLGWTLDAMADPNSNNWVIFGWVAAMATTNLLSAIGGSTAFRHMWHMGLKVNAANVSAMYRKSLLLSNASRQGMTQGEIMNRLSSDAQTIFNFSSISLLLVVAPIQLIASIILIYERIGVALFAGLGAMLLLAPWNGVLGLRFQKLSKAKQAASDNRLKIVQDVLNGIRLVKLYAWEESLKKRISVARSVETRVLYKYLLNLAMFIASMGFLPIVSILAIFATYSALGGAMTPSVVFSTLNLLDLLRMPLTMLPMVVAFSFSAMVSVNRVKKFLLMEEQEKVPSDPIVSSQVFSEGKYGDDVVAVIEDGEFTWKGMPVDMPEIVVEEKKEEEEKVDEGKEEKKVKVDEGKEEEKEEEKIHEEDEQPTGAVLTGINMTVRKGDLIMIVSPVGGGKSTLLSSMLGEVNCTGGKVGIRGSTALVEQKPWLGTATVTDNIRSGVIGRELQTAEEDQLLKKVIRACALEDDIKVLPAGLDTEIGERGLNLSGGQIARVALARAVYADADIYLLDDVLSAVDAHVGKHIFDKVISPDHGMLKKKAVILTTNQLQFLAYATRILMLNKRGELIESGTFDELMSLGGGFSMLIKEHAHDVKKKATPRTRTLSTCSTPASTILDAEDAPEFMLDTTKSVVDGKLIAEEERRAGAVPLDVYKKFLKVAGGPLFYVTYVVFNLLAVFAMYGSYIWIAIWTDGASFVGMGLDFWIGGYAVVLAVGLLLQLIVGYTFATGLTRAVSRTHDTLFDSVVHSPQKFFDTTPTGRIVNRFSKDVFQMDMEAPTFLQQVLSQTYMLLAGLIMAGVVAPPVLIAFIPLGYLYYRIQKYYRLSSREIQRIDATSKAHVVTHYSESISGLSTLRAFGLTKHYLNEAFRKVDNNHRAFYIIKIAQRWLAIRVSLYGAILVVAVGLSLSLLRGFIGAAFAGLALSNLNGMTHIMQQYVQMVTELETRMTSIERIQEYSELETEPRNGDEVESEWPAGGEIEFDKVSMRYRDELPLVLHDVSFTVNAGEKLGVVGRTGSGKSSLAIALFRVVSAATGRIIVDGQDISNISLKDLRSNIAIIPQQPVMFEGTVRFNLDPFDEYGDGDVWASLEIVQLKETIGEFDGKLTAPVKEGGANFSVGQRQLICFARALLRNPKILVMDEATASVDVQTDAIIQKVIRSQFKAATVITVAHRLNTIMDSTRVLVMDDGRVAEIDVPIKLLDDSFSLFSALVKETGGQNAQHLRELAEAAASGKVDEVVDMIVSQDELVEEE